MTITSKERNWYYNKISEIDPDQIIIKLDTSEHIINYSPKLRSDESSTREATPEELVHALAICLLNTEAYKYHIDDLYHEKRFEHGSKGSLSDEVDLIIFDNDNLPFAMWEFKAANEYDKNEDYSIKYQLFGTAPLVGAPKLLVYATIRPNADHPIFQLKCIDYTKYISYESWSEAGKPCTQIFPPDYQEPGYEPFVNAGAIDLRLDCTQAEFRAVATIFHNEFFSEHPDNVLYVNLVKCLLAKIFDEKYTKKGEPYKFQIFLRSGKDESAMEVFNRINELYSTAYRRYIDSSATGLDEINPKEFPPERVKTVVKVLESMSITRGAAIHGDIIGAFFEEILRIGFKQDKGMYFTHDNLVLFMVEAVDLRGLTIHTWKKATHPENRLPYVIDPACGSGTFLLKAMQIITETVRNSKHKLVIDFESEQFYNARLSDNNPNYWAENFIYGLDPKFVMAITAQVNMVLHGDGSAHIFKKDAFKPLLSFSENKFRPAGDQNRTIPVNRYEYDVCETFDLVVSNPPFGITLASDTQTSINNSFSLKDSVPSEALFLERCFQLLKPRGRLAIVVPISLLNTAEAIDVRMLLYRCFWIKTIVELPRNVFIDTPTLTSLLFAQKKTREEIAEWDDAWDKFERRTKTTIKKTLTLFKTVSKQQENITLLEIQDSVLKNLSFIVSQNTWILKRGKNAELLKFTLPQHIEKINEAIKYYKDILKLAAFSSLVNNYIFSQMAQKFDYQYPVFIVDEVGYKLSKRKERLKPNQLIRLVGEKTNNEKPNLHLTNEPVKLIVDINNPDKVLDFIRKFVEWEK
jgi:type I restriction enzyme M protein